MIKYCTVLPELKRKVCNNCLYRDPLPYAPSCSVQNKDGVVFTVCLKEYKEMVLKIEEGEKELDDLLRKKEIPND